MSAPCSECPIKNTCLGRTDALQWVWLAVLAMACLVATALVMAYGVKSDAKHARAAAEAASKEASLVDAKQRVKDTAEIVTWIGMLAPKQDGTVSRITDAEQGLRSDGAVVWRPVKQQERKQEAR